MLELFELNPEWIEIALTITKRGSIRRVAHVLRKPMEDDWIRYDRGLNVAVRDVKIDDGQTGTSITNKDAESACELWDALKIGAQGYREGEEVSPAQKQIAIDQLLRVWPAPDSAYEGLADEACEIVILQARRGTTHERLLHTFAKPTAAQRIEYRRAMADSLIVPAKEGQRVILPSRMTRLIKLYDALIQGVDGYQVNGIPVPGGDANAMRKMLSGFMDAQHKVIAVSVLFTAEQVTAA
jgi:hypothetical protein